MNDIVEKSKKFLLDNREYYNRNITNWISFGDAANYDVILNTGNKKWSSSALEALELLEEANIETKDEIVLYRETNYPLNNIPVLTSAAYSPDGFNGTFGEKIYKIFIPKGTRIFYISALDEIDGKKRSETEEEFLLSPGITTLDSNNNILYTPLQFDIDRLSSIYY